MCGAILAHTDVTTKKERSKMGRYYNGDINGKFWFAVQSSCAADRFGGTRYEPSTIDYYFSDGDLDKVQKELKLLENLLDLDKLEKFFGDRAYYSQDDLEEAGIESDELSHYADYILGKKIEECIKEKGECSFEAEL